MMNYCYVNLVFINATASTKVLITELSVESRSAVRSETNFSTRDENTKYVE